MRPGEKIAKRTADGSEAQKPTSTRPRFAIAFSLTLTQDGRGESTRRKSIGSGGAMRKACGPGCAEMQIHPPREQTCEGLNPMSAAGRSREGPIVRPGRERPRGRVAERRVRDTTAHDPSWTAEFLRRRSCDWIAGERVNRIRRSHSRRRSKMTALSDLMCIPRWSAVKAVIERTSRRFIHHASIAAADSVMRKTARAKVRPESPQQRGGSHETPKRDCAEAGSPAQRNAASEC